MDRDEGEGIGMKGIGIRTASSSSLLHSLLHSSSYSPVSRPLKFEGRRTTVVSGYGRATRVES